MKTKQKEELKTKKIDELAKLAEKKQATIGRLKLELKAGKLKNVRLVKKERHDLARLKTLIKQKELTG